MSAYPDVDRALAIGDARTAYALLCARAEEKAADAFFELAIWFLEGRLVRRDLHRSRGMFIEAAKLGHESAISVASAFLASGVGGPRDWPTALKLLKASARTDALMGREMALLSAMTITADGLPRETPQVELVSEDPRIAWVRNFMTEEECALLIDRARGTLSPSVIIDPASGMARPDPIRTSQNAMFPWPNETPFIHAINQRIAGVAGYSHECGEPLQVLRYAESQEYRRHSDALTGEPNQRVLTALVYLNDGFDGGQTEFPELGLSLKGNCGDLLLFSNTLEDGRTHPLAVHAGQPVTRGEKWLASRWIRRKPFGVRQ